MNVSSLVTSCGAVLMVSFAAASLCATSAVPASAANEFKQTNLVSNLPGVAQLQDTNLVNAWGISEGPNTPFWISDNGTGVSTLYSVPPIAKVPLTVTVPPLSGSAPTGQVFNPLASSGAFGGAHFLFDTEDGVISGWSAGTNALIEKDNSGSAVYKGLAITTSMGGILYATNFTAGRVEAFNSSFGSASLAGNFQDPNLPAGYAPFNDSVINGKLFVTFALKDPNSDDELHGPGEGLVDVFNLDGTFDTRLISNGALNAPWGLAMAPAGFGAFGGDLLVGNFGDGTINAYDPTTGVWAGALDGPGGNPLSIDGLWGLTFGNGAAGGRLDTLYFTAGPNGEADGLFGSLTAVPELSTWAMLLLGFGVLGVVAFQRRRSSIATV